MPVGDDDTVASSTPTTTVQGEGAYEASDDELGEHVALKFLRRGLSDDAIERFRREVKLTRRIVHHNVARMFDIGEHAGDKFLTMELVHGDALSKLVPSAPLPW